MISIINLTYIFYGVIFCSSEKIEMDSLRSRVSKQKQYKMAQVENDVPEILTNVATLTIEYTQISDAFDADVELAKRAFKKKYQACVQAEMSCLEGTGGDISDFTSQVSLLKAENTQTMGLLRGKQSKISKDLRNKLGEFDMDVSRVNAATAAGMVEILASEYGFNAAEAIQCLCFDSVEVSCPMKKNASLGSSRKLSKNLRDICVQRSVALAQEEVGVKGSSCRRYTRSASWMSNELQSIIQAMQKIGFPKSHPDCSQAHGPWTTGGQLWQFHLELDKLQELHNSLFS